MAPWLLDRTAIVHDRACNISTLTSTETRHAPNLWSNSFLQQPEWSLYVFSKFLSGRPSVVCAGFTSSLAIVQRSPGLDSNTQHPSASFYITLLLVYEVSHSVAFWLLIFRLSGIQESFSGQHISVPMYYASFLGANISHLLAVFK